MTKISFEKYPKLDKPITVKLTKYNYDRLANYCKIRNLKMSVVIRVILNWWLDNEKDV